MKQTGLVHSLRRGRLGAALPVRAQDAPPAPAPDRQSVRQNLSTLRLLRLTEALELTEVQTAKIFPFLTRVEKDKLSIQKACPKT